MSDLGRIGVAIDGSLFRRFDHELVEKMWQGPDDSVVGAVHLVYDHGMCHNILSVMHVHLDYPTGAKP